MFGVSLPNTEHQLAFLQHQYQQLHQENMFYQTCIKNQQQQLEELKAKKNPRTPSAEKKNRRTPQATKNNNVSASELQKTPPTLKPYFELKHNERVHRNIEIKSKFSEVASSLYSDITSVKVELEFHDGKNKYFYPRASASDGNSELKYSNRINDRYKTTSAYGQKENTGEKRGVKFA